MREDRPPDESAPDESALAESALAAAVNSELLDALRAALPRWVDRVAPGVDAAPILSAVLPEVEALLALDIDEQRTTPLAVVRDVAVPLLTAALASARRPLVDAASRDPFLAERFPDDVYGIAPAGWADIDESLVGPGIAWGATKAHLHRVRHRPKQD